MIGRPSWESQLFFGQSSFSFSSSYACVLLAPWTSAPSRWDT